MMSEWEAQLVQAVSGIAVIVLGLVWLIAPAINAWQQHRDYQDRPRRKK